MTARKILAHRTLSILLVVLVLAAFPAQGGPEVAPRFHAKTMDGESFDNQTVKGKVLLLQFWTTWCKYCRGEQSLVDDINKEFAPKGMIVLAVNVGESKKTVKKYLQDNPRAVRIVLTEDTNLAALYAATVYPIYVAVDREGNVAGIQRGAGGERALRRLLSDAGLESEEK